MFDVFQSLIILSMGLTISVQAAKLRCYGKSLTQFDAFELSDIEQLVDSQYYTKYKPNKIIIHGFKGNPDGRFVTNITLAYINAATASVDRTLPSEYNVLVLDWSEEASANPILGDAISYATKAIRQARLIGEQLADALAKIANIGFCVHHTQIIAHSLGSHNAGHCGRRLINVYNLKLARIYGLDPSGPLYDGPLPVDTPLKDDCAETVFCLHTDQGKKGINSSYCHIDAWANYVVTLRPNTTERVQPGCPIGNFEPFSEPDTCSHDYSWKLLNASLVAELSDSFLISFGNNYYEWARSNGSATPITKLPEKIDITLRGNFYFSASGNYPYALGEAGLRPVSETNQQGMRN